MPVNMSSRFGRYESAIFMLFAVITCIDGYRSLSANFLSQANLIMLAAPVLKYTIVIALLLANRPSRSTQVTGKALAGILLSFGAPVFLDVSNISVSGHAQIFVLAAFFFYSLILLFALAALGKNFGVLPALRNVVTTWPFSAIAHPMYGSYLHLVLLIVVINFSVQNVGLAVLSFLGLYLRAAEEESVLSKDPAYKNVLGGVRFRFVSPTFSLPLMIAASAMLVSWPQAQGLLGAHSESAGASSVKTLFPYAVHSISPLVYDEWHSVFIGNHIYRRLLAEPERNIPGATKDVSVSCASGDQKDDVTACAEQAVKINFSDIRDCLDQTIDKEQLKNEFHQTLKQMNWIFPGHRACADSGFDVCVQGPALPDLKRRLQNLYLRFGWSNLDLNFEQPMGTGPYCLYVDQKTQEGAILSGKLVPHPDFPDLPIVEFDTTEDKSKHLDFALFGFSDSGVEEYAEVHSHTPLGYYLVSHTKFESVCLPWERLEARELIKKHLTKIDFIFDQAGSLSELLSKGEEKKCDSYPLKFKKSLNLLLPGFITQCEQLKADLNQLFLNLDYQQVNIACGDTTKLIMDKVVAHAPDWDGFLSPLSPGYPGRQAIAVQYFSLDSASSWVPGAQRPELNYSLIGVGKSNITLNSKSFCDVRAVPMGMGDLFLTDLIRCK